jgi:hypothetical protein
MLEGLPSMKTITLFSMFGLGCLLAAGCTSSEQIGTTETTSVEVRPAMHVAVEAATREITGARCAKAEQCGDGGKGFKSLGACESAVRRDVRDELLETTRCNWIEAGQLSACLDAIRASDCAGPTTSVQGLESCRTLWMCR